MRWYANDLIQNKGHEDFFIRPDWEMEEDDRVATQQITEYMNWLLKVDVIDEQQ